MQYLGLTLLAASVAVTLPAQTNTFPASGNVGIGTTSPGTKLDVLGGGRITDALTLGDGHWSTEGTAYTALSTFGGTVIRGDTLNVGRVSVGSWTQQAPYAGFYVAGDALLGGKLGVGTSAPSAKLELGITNLWNVDEGISLARLGGPATRFSFKLKSDAGGYYRGALEFTPSFGSVTEVISISNEALGNAGVGNVGIGTISPGARLEVKGDETRLRAIVNKNDSTLRNLLRLTSDDTVGSGNLELAVGLQGGAAGNRRAQLQAGDNGFGWAALALNPYGGNVGIGMVNPPATLSVAGDQFLIKGSTAAFGTYDSHDLRLLGAAATGAPGKGVFIDYFNGGGWLKAAQIKNVSSGHGSLLLMQDGGNVGIGTTNPSNKLEVNGTIRTKEVVVETTGWSDYVFADDYRLAPLSEVEAHIKAKKHLPGISSAAEVAANGVNVGEMQAKLLAKVEELTLHMIRLEKENSELKRAVQQLQGSH